MMISKEYEENWCDKLTSCTIVDVKEECLLKFYENATECGRLPKIGFNKETLLIQHNLLRNSFLYKCWCNAFWKFKSNYIEIGRICYK